VETAKKRLRALEVKAAEDGLVLTDRQVAALERVARDKFGSECPGYCGAHDTFCVGTLKGWAASPADLH
jgi:hypothetical protein